MGKIGLRDIVYIWIYLRDHLLIFLMQQQNSYLRNNNQPTSYNQYNPQNQPSSQNQPHLSLSLNNPQPSYSNQSTSQLSFQAQGPSNYPQNNLGNSNYVQSSYGQNNPGQHHGQTNFNQNNYPQNTSGQFNLSLNSSGQNNPQNNLGPQNPYENRSQPQPQAPPTTSAEIAAYMKKRPYTQMLGGDEFTFSVYPKKQASFFMTHERLLMLKGYEIIAYAREFPANKQLPFASLADVPAPKVSYPLAQVEKAEVAEQKLIITFAGPTKVTWEFHTANKNSSIQWAQKINAAKQTALSHGAQTNPNFKYDEDVLGRSVYDSPQKPQPTGINVGLGNNSFSISGNTGLNSSPNGNYGLNSSPNQSNNIRIEERSNYSSNSYNQNLGNNNYNPNLGSNYGSSFNNNNNYNQNSNLNLNTNQYSSTYQTGTPQRNQSTFSLNTQLNSNPQNYNYQSTNNYGSNSNYQPANIETRETKQQSFSTQGQSTYSNSSNNLSFNANINSNMSRYPLSGQSTISQQQPDPRAYEQRPYEPPRHF